MSLTFQKKVEDFTCEKCGAEVKGNGYTNHCPQCLWSKHVDINPGDRLADCQGLMEPIDVIHETGKYILVQKCVTCGHMRRNRLEVADNFDTAAAIVKKKADKVSGLAGKQ